MSSGAAYITTARFHKIGSAKGSTQIQSSLPPRSIDHTVLSLLLTLCGLFLCAPANCAEENPAPGVRAAVLVQAEPRLVYEAIRHQRQGDAGRGKELSRSEDRIVVEEEMNRPVLGHVSCVYEEVYTPKRIEYKMIKSDKFKAFEGAWTLTPEEGGKETNVELYSYVDTGLRVPFCRRLTNTQTLKDVKQRLSFVKNWAESGEKSGLIARRPRCR